MVPTPTAPTAPPTPHRGSGSPAVTPDSSYSDAFRSRSVPSPIWSIRANVKDPPDLLDDALSGKR